MKTAFIWCILVHIACLRSLQQDGAMLASIIFPLAYFSSHFQYIFCPTFYIFFNTFKPYFQPISAFSVYFIPPTHPQKTNTNQLPKVLLSVSTHCFTWMQENFSISTYETSLLPYSSFSSNFANYYYDFIFVNAVVVMENHLYQLSLL